EPRLYSYWRSKNQYQNGGNRLFSANRCIAAVMTSNTIKTMSRLRANGLRGLRVTIHAAPIQPAAIAASERKNRTRNSIQASLFSKAIATGKYIPAPQRVNSLNTRVVC